MDAEVHHASDPTPIRISLTMSRLRPSISFRSDSGLVQTRQCPGTPPRSQMPPPCEGETAGPQRSEPSPLLWPLIRNFRPIHGFFARFTRCTARLRSASQRITPATASTGAQSRWLQRSMPDRVDKLYEKDDSRSIFRACGCDVAHQPIRPSRRGHSPRAAAMRRGRPGSVRSYGAHCDHCTLVCDYGRIDFQFRDGVPHKSRARARTTRRPQPEAQVAATRDTCVWASLQAALWRL